MKSRPEGHEVPVEHVAAPASATAPGMLLALSLASSSMLAAPLLWLGAPPAVQPLPPSGNASAKSSATGASQAVDVGDSPATVALAVPATSSAVAESATPLNGRRTCNATPPLRRAAAGTTAVVASDAKCSAVNSSGSSVMSERRFLRAAAGTERGTGAGTAGARVASATAASGAGRQRAAHKSLAPQPPAQARPRCPAG
jgi:hypothetical protein